MSILGQHRALEILAAALRSGRFHHAWILSGPRGVGKFTTAMQLARLLLDPDVSLQSVNDRLEVPQQDARTQRLIDAGTHPDLHIVRKELARYSDNRELRERKQLNIPIDLLRERIIGGKVGETVHEAPAYRTAALGHGKVFIIDEAELLAREAQNSMLKTLEEPPAQTYLFLITSQPQRLFPTILSRCQHVRFGKLDEAAMREWWTRHERALAAKHMLQDEPDEPKPRKGAGGAKAGGGKRDGRGSAKAAGIDRASAMSDPKAVQWALRFAEGSPGMALLALEYGFHQWHAAIEPMLADLERGKFPHALGDTMGSLVDDFALAWVKAHGEQTTSKDAANKDGARHMFGLLASHARRRVEAMIDAGDDASPWLAAIEAIRDAERELEFNVNQKLLLEDLAAQWAQAVRRRPEAAGSRQ